MIDPPFRSPREPVGGLYYFGRMLDKIRCNLREKLPEEYRPNFGLSVGLDGMLCGMLGLPTLISSNRCAAAGRIRRFSSGAMRGAHALIARRSTSGTNSREKSAG